MRFLRDKPLERAKIHQALRYAAEAHHGQTLPGSDLPYVVHLAMVAMEVMAAPAREDDLDGDLALSKTDDLISKRDQMQDSLERIKQ